jgi:SRSO17 transposase
MVGTTSDSKTGLRMLAAIIKARWICEQAHQQLKEELGLDHFEGRSWQGLHRHALMTMIAYAFLQHRRLIRAKREKKNQRTTTSAKLASRAPRYLDPAPPAVSPVRGFGGDGARRGRYGVGENAVTYY